MRETTTRLDTFLKIHAKLLACARKINDVKMHVKCSVSCRVHRGLHEQRACIFGLHELHSCILVCTNCTRAFWFAQECVTHFVYFISVHSGLAYTQVIHSKSNTCVHTYLLLHHREHMYFYKFTAGNVNCYTFE